MSRDRKISGPRTQATKPSWDGIFGITDQRVQFEETILPEMH